MVPAVRRPRLYRGCRLAEVVSNHLACYRLAGTTAETLPTSAFRPSGNNIPGLLHCCRAAREL